MKVIIKNWFKFIIIIIVVISFWFILLSRPPFSLFEKDQTNIQKNIFPIKYITVENRSLCQAISPKDRMIILRMDDVQGYLWNKIVINLTNTILDKICLLF